ncbi:methylated-DNA--[protein]-cysteine S-methyltransferase [Mesorhizobium sp. SB112]|uniref:methylated-DNA--[protein]-cysteine S-methyltransferase n=1 Tax=Mesorhizobium sp. SB112 TaxID=3151853 RepID=UPI0032666C3D
MQNSAAILRLTVDTLATPIGDFLIVADDEGILRAGEFADRDLRLRTMLDRRLGTARYTLLPGHGPAQTRDAMSAYFAGELSAINTIPTKAGGTSFQETVWAELRRLQAGKATTYAALAQRIERTQSPRAVGHANGANPISIIIPCHRLVGASGHLTGYGGGLERKRWLLDHEARFSGHSA